MLLSLEMPECVPQPPPTPCPVPWHVPVSGDSGCTPAPNLNPHLSKPFKLMATICKAIAGPAHNPYKELVNCACCACVGMDGVCVCAAWGRVDGALGSDTLRMHRPTLCRVHCQFYTKLATALENHDQVITRVQDLAHVKRLPSRKGGTEKTISKVGGAGCPLLSSWAENEE
jgi:hypothetical protein